MDVCMYITTHQPFFYPLLSYHILSLGLGSILSFRFLSFRSFVCLYVYLIVRSGSPRFPPSSAPASASILHLLPISPSCESGMLLSPRSTSDLCQCENRESRIENLVR